MIDAPVAYMVADILSDPKNLTFRLNGYDPDYPTYEFGDITMDVRKAEVRRGGKVIDLSAREFLLLKYFVEHREATLTRDELLNDVWGYHSMPSTRTVDVHVAWLRQKIEPDVKHPQYIVTVHGLGYKFIG